MEHGCFYLPQVFRYKYSKPLFGNLTGKAMGKMCTSLALVMEIFLSMIILKTLLSTADMGGGEIE